MANSQSCFKVFGFITAYFLVSSCAALQACAQDVQPVAPASQSPAQPVPLGQTTPAANQGVQDKRVFGVLPNYRTGEGAAPFVPLTTKQKFTIAKKDSFDYPVLLTTGFFAGLSQVRGSDNNIYGQGTEGFAHRFGISYLDQVVGNFFPEAIFPTLLHDDPRYFRKGEGTIRARLLYAITRIVICKNDAGKLTFNAPEIFGNVTAATVGLSFHPHERTAGDAAEQAATYWESDTIGQVMKEFWPDIKRRLKRRHQKTADQGI